MADDTQPQPSGPPPLRASDEDRQRVADVLREHTSAGRLTLEEFEQRVAEAYAAKTVAELRPLLADLPVDVASLLPAEPSAQPPIAPLPWMPPGSGQVPWLPHSSLPSHWVPHHPATVRRQPAVRPAVAALGVVFLVLAVTAISRGVFAWPLLIVAFVMFGHSGRHGQRHPRNYRHSR